MSDKWWVLEWCAAGKQQGRFHVRPLEQSLENNMEAYRLQDKFGITPMWIILGVFATEEDAYFFQDRIQPHMPNL